MHLAGQFGASMPGRHPDAKPLLAHPLMGGFAPNLVRPQQPQQFVQPFPLPPPQLKFPPQPPLGQGFPNPGPYPPVLMTPQQPQLVKPVMPQLGLVPQSLPRQPFMKPDLVDQRQRPKPDMTPADARYAEEMRIYQQKLREYEEYQAQLVRSGESEEARYARETREYQQKLKEYEEQKAAWDRQHSQRTGGGGGNSSSSSSNSNNNNNNNTNNTNNNNSNINFNNSDKRGRDFDRDRGNSPPPRRIGDFSASVSSSSTSSSSSFRKPDRSSAPSRFSRSSPLPPRRRRHSRSRSRSRSRGRSPLHKNSKLSSAVTLTKVFQSHQQELIYQQKNQIEQDAKVRLKIEPTLPDGTIPVIISAPSQEALGSALVQIETQIIGPSARIPPPTATSFSSQLPSRTVVNNEVFDPEEERYQRQLAEYQVKLKVYEKYQQDLAEYEKQKAAWEQQRSMAVNNNLAPDNKLGALKQMGGYPPRRSSPQLMDPRDVRHETNSRDKAPRLGGPASLMSLPVSDVRRVGNFAPPTVAPAIPTPSPDVRRGGPPDPIAPPPPPVRRIGLPASNAPRRIGF